MTILHAADFLLYLNFIIMKKIVRIALINLTLLSILFFGTSTIIVPSPLLRNIVTSSNYQGEALISFQYKDADIIYLYKYNERNEPELIHELDTSELNFWVDSAFYIRDLEEGLHTF